MTKILGLDLGTNSIGWAVVDKENGKMALMHKGVRIFQEGVKNKEGKESSKAAERTGYRSARRIKFRRKLRKFETLLVLAQNNMCPLSVEEVYSWKKSNFKEYPSNNEFREWLKTDESQNINPYYYRFRATIEKIDKLQLGRAFYHIAQRRGFLSNRLEQSDDTIIQEFKEKIEEILEKSKDKNSLLKAINHVFEPFEFENKKDKDLDTTERKLNQIRKYIISIAKNEIKNKDFQQIDIAKNEIKHYINRNDNIGAVKGGINALSERIKKEGCLTLGQFFWILYQRDRNDSKNKIRVNYTAREEHYIYEFEFLCQQQGLTGIETQEKSSEKRYYGIVEDLYKAIFYQRPLKSQKSLVGKCSFEKKKSRCPVSHPEFEEFRMWCFINTIKVKDNSNDKFRFLIENEIAGIVPKFYRKSKPHFDFVDLKKELGAEKHYNYKDNATVSGCPTSANLKLIFGDDWKSISFKYSTTDKKNGLKARHVDYRDIWHVLFTFTTTEKLEEFAREKLKLNPILASKLSRISLKKDYASLSLSSICKITPYLKKGLIYSHAVFMANVSKVVDSGVWEDADKRETVEKGFSKIINDHNEYLTKIKIINDLVGWHKIEFNNANNQYQFDNQDSEKLDKKIIEHYGENKWGSFDQNKKDEITEEIKDRFINCLQNSYPNAYKFVETRRLDQRISDFLLGKNETGEIFCSEKNRMEKLYHPSDIDRFQPIEKWTEDGQVLKLLGNPSTPSVRNPMAMRSLYQLRELINSLIVEEKISSDTKVNIELARELNDANKRKAIKRYQDERKDLRNIYAEKISELYQNKTGKEIVPSSEDILKFQLLTEQERNGNLLITKDDILKYQYWEEQRHICLYTGKTIGIADFIGQDPNFDIEHTLPRSNSEDNSQMNKTLCFNRYNREIKKQKLPTELENYEKSHDYHTNEGIINCQAILPSIEHWRKKYEEYDALVYRAIKSTKRASTKEQKDKWIQERHYLSLHRDYWKGKYERFTVTEITSGFKNSQKVDIGVISKYAREYLSSVFNKVYSVKGEMVAEFRKIWGLQESFINEFGQKDYEPKDRSNHIHHCIDAITIACMDKNKYDLLAHAWALEEKGQLENARKKLEDSKPWNDFAQNVKDIVDDVVIVHHTPNNAIKQNKKKLRVRGRIVHKVIYKKDVRGKYLLDEKGNKIVDSYIYKKDKGGNKIPVFGRRLLDADIRNKVENSDYFCHIVDGDVCYYEYAKNSKEQIVYQKEAIIQQGDTVRGSLHQDTFYGAIKQPLKDKSGNIIRDEHKKMKFPEDQNGNPEITYVVRKELKSLKKGEIPKIVDSEVLKKIEKAVSDKVLIMSSNDQQANKLNGIVWMNEEKKIPINKVRIRASTKSPLAIKKHRDKSKASQLYKQRIYAANEENYCMAIYEGTNKAGKIERLCELVNLMDAGEYYKPSKSDYRQLNTIVPEKSIEKNYPLKMINNKPLILTKGLMVLLYDKTPDEIWDLSEKERLTRLYKITQLDVEKFAEIKLLYHQEAREKKEITKHMGLKSGMKGGKNIGKYREFPWIKVGANNFDALVEGYHFEITPLGEIIQIE